MQSDNSRPHKTLPKKHWDSTFRLMQWWQPETVQNAKVMVIGAGALGNEVLKNLALMNVGNIFIVDFDKVEYANLSRSILFREEDCEPPQFKAEVAAKRLKEINPNIKVQTIIGDVEIDVGLGLIRRMDVMIGCLDNRQARLAIDRACHKMKKPWIDGGIENLAGRATVYTPGISCYEATLTQADFNLLQYQASCPDRAKKIISQGKIPTTPLSASIIGAIQVQEALKIIHQQKEQSMGGKEFFFQGMNNYMGLFNAAPLPEDCPCLTDIYEPIKEIKKLHHQLRVKELIDILKEEFQEDNPQIMLDFSIVLEITPEISQKKTTLVKAKPQLSEEDTDPYRTEPNEEVFVTKETHILDEQFPFQEKKLIELGIAPLQILQVYAKGETHFVELTGEEKFINFI